MMIGRAPKKRSLFASTWDDRSTRATIRYPLVPSLGYCQLQGKINQRSLPLAAVSESCLYCTFPLLVLFNSAAALLWLGRTWWQNKEKCLRTKEIKKIILVNLTSSCCSFKDWQIFLRSGIKMKNIYLNSKEKKPNIKKVC